MPLYFLTEETGEALEEWLNKSTVDLLHFVYAQCQLSAAAFRRLPVVEPSSNCIFVSQREFAVVQTTSSDDITFIGSDEATTCHIVYLLHRASGMALVAHCDDVSCSSTHVNALMQEFHLSEPRSKDEFELYMVGGFSDIRGQSECISKSLLEAFNRRPETIYIKMACISALNNEKRPDCDAPAICGIAVDTGTLTVYPAHFSHNHKGPALPLRGTYSLRGPHRLRKVFDSRESSDFVIEPFNYCCMEQAEDLLKCDDKLLLEHTSSSPLVEFDSYPADMRTTLTFMLTHPTGRQAFPDWKAKRFRYDPAGQDWINISTA